MLRSLLVATGLQIPITNEVLFKDPKTHAWRSQGTGNDLIVNTCESDTYQPPVSMGIIEKGQVVKVVGGEVKVELHMRGRCDKYEAYDYVVGKCDPTLGGAGGETPVDEWTAPVPIQSYEIKQCAPKKLEKKVTWQFAMNLPENIETVAECGQGHADAVMDIVLSGPSNALLCGADKPCGKCEAVCMEHPQVGDIAHGCQEFCAS